MPPPCRVRTVALELAVQASSTYFDAFQQEKLRRAVVSTLGVRDERVVHSGVLSTNIGQVCLVECFVCCKHDGLIIAPAYFVVMAELY